MCLVHENRVDWVRPFCYKIEKLGEKTIEHPENSFSKREVDDILAKRKLPELPKVLSPHTVREYLIDLIVATLPVVVDRKLFESWPLEELKRFSPMVCDAPRDKLL